MNYVVLTGRIVSELKTFETEEGKKYSKISIAVPRSYKNEDGIYETDFIDCILYNHLAEQTENWCNTGDLIGIRGRIETKLIPDSKNNKVKKEMIIVADRVTFLSSKRPEESDK